MKKLDEAYNLDVSVLGIRYALLSLLVGKLTGLPNKRANVCTLPFVRKKKTI